MSLIDDLIDAARNDETQCHYGTAGSRASARTDLQEAEKALRGQLEAMQAEIEVVRAKYDELIFAVKNKYEGETRHETALRYLAERQNRPQSKAGHSQESAK